MTRQRLRVPILLPVLLQALFTASCVAEPAQVVPTPAVLSPREVSAPDAPLCKDPSFSRLNSGDIAVWTSARWYKRLCSGAVTAGGRAYRILPDPDDIPNGICPKSASSNPRDVSKFDIDCAVVALEDPGSRSSSPELRAYRDALDLVFSGGDACNVVDELTKGLSPIVARGHEVTDPGFRVVASHSAYFLAEVLYACGQRDLSETYVRDSLFLGHPGGGDTLRRFMSGAL